MTQVCLLLTTPLTEVQLFSLHSLESEKEKDLCHLVSDCVLCRLCLTDTHTLSNRDICK